MNSVWNGELYVQWSDLVSCVKSGLTESLNNYSFYRTKR